MAKGKNKKPTSKEVEPVLDEKESKAVEEIIEEALADGELSEDEVEAIEEAVAEEAPEEIAETPEPEAEPEKEENKYEFATCAHSRTKRVLARGNRVTHVCLSCNQVVKVGGR